MNLFDFVVEMKIQKTGSLTNKLCQQMIEVVQRNLRGLRRKFEGKVDDERNDENL